MTAPRRGLANERHTRLKLSIAALSLAGFAGGWALLGATNEPAAAEPPPSTPTAAASHPASTSLTPAATATRRPRQSRGS